MFFEKPDAANAYKLEPFFHMRKNKTCFSGMLDFYLWADYYGTTASVVDNKAILLHMCDGDEDFSSLPWCSAEDLPHYFNVLKKYFNEELKKPLIIYGADEDGVVALDLLNNADFEVEELDDFKDYLYSADDLKNLHGKAFQKKRNRISKFERDYEGRWEYTTLGCDEKEAIAAFAKEWYDLKKTDETESPESLEYEERGIRFLLQNCESLPFMGGAIKIDGKIRAFSIGSSNPLEKMAIISIEKADSSIDGIYQIINREFLRHEFPDVEIVNREDDLGIEGLRKAKQSYNPIGYAKKFSVKQKNF